MNRTDRLVALVTYLQSRRVVRAEELARHFEVSERTIYRDVAALSEAGIPVVGEAGVGYSLMKGYHLPPVMFTAEEAMALAVGEDLVRRFTDKSLATPMATALLKIRSVLPRERQDDLDRLAASTAIEGRAALPAELENRILLPIQQAVVGRRVLKLGYCSRDGSATERCIEPLGVVYYGDAWYLVGWCRLRRDYRHFKLGRINTLEVLSERFAPREEFRLQDHLKETKGAAAQIEIQLWLSDGALERARRECYTDFLREERSGPDGSVVALRVFTLDWVARWIVSFGGEAEALAPLELRHKVIECARQVVEKHAVTHTPDTRLSPVAARLAVDV